MPRRDELPVIVLAAGRGIRLGDITREMPKCMLGVGGETIIRRQVRQLGEVGLRDIHVVTGYRSDLVEGHLEGTDVRYVHNGLWSTTNNIYSLHLARDRAPDGFYLLNGDVACDAGILRNFASTSGTAMVIDDVKELGEEEMKVSIRDGRIMCIGKALDPRKAHGEYIGLMRFTGDESRMLFDSIARFVSAGQMGVWYENALEPILGDIILRPVFTGGLDWIEVDTPEDNRRMNDMFSR